jgi:tetratricopeptide (TPR) repeat protein
VTSEPSPPLSKHVVVDVSPARVARLWARVSERLDATPSSSKRWWVRGLVAAGAVTALAVVGVGVQRYRGSVEAVSAWQGAALETAGDAMAVELDDGSRLEVAAHTHVKMTENRPSTVALALSRGRVDLDISPRPGRKFSVVAAGVEVRVTGTRFSVELSSERRVEVEVTRGSVEVLGRGATAPKRLAAGERWSVDLDQPVVGDAAPAASETAEPPSAPVEVNAPRPSASPPAREPAVAGPRELFDLGNAARRAGDVSGAARAYELLLEQHPRDARAGLAAFELGRLRMDRLGDVHGAIQALQRAVALAPGAGFREDAMARLVDAYASAGATERCRSAQSAYLESYPKGVRASAIARRCGTNKSP